MRYTAALAALLLCAAPAMAETTVLGDLRIELPMLRETPANAPVGAGYLTIVNAGDDDDRLTGATVAGDVAEEVQLHEMSMADGVMTMTAVEGGIPLPAGETVTLASGGRHLMIMGLERPLTAGESHAVTLTFAEAGEITLDMPVLTLAEIRATGEGSGGSEGSGGGEAMDHSAHGGGRAGHAPEGR